jgi:hypothetical protein
LAARALTHHHILALIAGRDSHNAAAASWR